MSRDIKELGLTKMSLDGNPARYTLAGEKRTYRSEEHLKRLFRDSVVGLDFSENLIVIKTHPGEAQAVALAIDQVGWKEIIGTVGGDDTVLVIVKPKRETGAVLKRFEDLSLNRGKNMLLSLFIRNSGIIELLNMDLDRGLNVLTGETGAGKSIIIEALQLALGDALPLNRYVAEQKKPWYKPLLVLTACLP